jgi:hypothetical protein
MFVATVVVATLLYAPSLAFKPTWDDFSTVERHPGVQGPLSFGHIFGLDFWGHAFHAPDAIGTYRPLVTASFWLDVHVARSPVVLHATNLLIFALVSIVGERVLRRFALGERARLVAIASFASLAIHVDVVPSVTGRSELLAALFALFAVDLAYESVAHPRFIPLAWLALAAALLSKESTLPFTLLLPLLAYRRAERAERGRVVLLGAGTLALLGGFLAFRVANLPLRVQGLGWRFSNPLIDAPTPIRWAGVGQAFEHYLEHTLAPVDLCPDYGYASLVPRVGLRAAVGWALVAIAVAGVALAARRASRALDPLLGLAASYVVVSHLLVVSSAFVADRQFFLPSFFLCALFGLAFERLALASVRAEKLAKLAVAAFVLVQVVLTAAAIPAWRDNVSLSAYAVQNCPSSMRMQVFRSGVQQHLGEHEDAAWSAVLAEAIVSGFPQPIDDDLFASLTDASADRRIAMSVERMGRERFLLLLEDTAGALERKPYPEALAIVRRWSAEVSGGRAARP